MGILMQWIINLIEEDKRGARVLAGIGGVIGLLILAEALLSPSRPSRFSTEPVSREQVQQIADDAYRDVIQDRR